MVITEVPTSPGSLFLFAALRGVLKSHLFSFFTFRLWLQGKKSFQIKSQDKELENTHSLERKQIILFSKNEGDL